MRGRTAAASRWCGFAIERAVQAVRTFIAADGKLPRTSICSTSMPPRSRKHLTAWLGLVAMWLIVLAPIVSQLVVAAHRTDPAAAALCSAGQAPTDSAHVARADPLAACGYCDLLADHIAMPAVPPSPLVLVMLLVAVAVPALSVRFTPLGAFPSGRPRAPPAFF